MLHKLYVNLTLKMYFEFDIITCLEKEQNEMQLPHSVLIVLILQTFSHSHKMHKNIIKDVIK